MITIGQEVQMQDRTIRCTILITMQLIIERYRALQLTTNLVVFLKISCCWVCRIMVENGQFLILRFLQLQLAMVKLQFIEL